MTTDTRYSERRAHLSGRAPRRFTAGRVCTHPECTTLLSTYNSKETCFRHSPLAFPRTRGRPTAA